MAKETNRFIKYTDEKTFKRIVSFNSVAEMWKNSVKNYANEIALCTIDQKLTYANLDDEVAYFRTVLVENGIKKGDNVGIYMPNSIDFVKAYLAITTLGAVAVLLPPQLDNMTIFGCSMKFNLTAIIYHQTLGNNTDIVSLKNPKTKLILSTETRTNKTSAVQIDGKDLSTIIFTGGTTGKSKGSVLSNKAVMLGVRNSCYGTKEVFNQKYLLVLPLTHVFGLIRNMLASLYTGSQMFICGNNKDMFRDIAVFKPTIMILVPALAEMALQLSKNFNKNMLGESMKTIICGAANVPPYLVHEYHKMGISLLPGYGLTESANLVSGNPNALEKSSSVGFVYPDIETKVVDGELWLKGPNMQEAYYQDDEENKNSYEDGWFKTGDLVRFDEDGYLYIVGRKKEIIVLPSGENISPAELEAEFLAIEEIQDCLVFLGKNNTLELEVYLRNSAIKENKIENPQEYVKQQVFKINDKLLSHQKITNVKFRDVDFVRSPSMKIIRSKNGNV